MTHATPSLDETPRSGAKTGARPKVWRLLRWALALGLLSVVATRVDWHEFTRVAIGIRPEWLAAVTLASGLDRLFMAGKWHYLVRRLGVRISFIETALSYFLGTLVGMAAQWQLSGDIARAVRVGYQSGQHRRVAFSVVFEKLCGFAASGILATVSLLLLNSQLRVVPQGVALAAGVLVGALLAVGPLLVFSSAGGRLASAVVRLIPRVGARVAIRLPSTSGERGSLQRVVLIFFGLTFLEQLVPLVTNTLTQRSLNLEVGFIQTLSVVPVIMFLSRLPISIDGIGVYEGLSVLLFGLMGLSATEAFTLALTGRFVSLVSAGAGTLVCMVIHGHRMPRASFVQAEEGVDPDL